MTLYSLNGAEPVAVLPHRVRYQGRNYTDPAQWFPAIGADLGWAEVAEKPSHDAATQHPPAWTGSAWTVADKTVAERQTELKASVTEKFRAERDKGTAVGGVAISTTHSAALEISQALELINSTDPTGTIDVVTRGGTPLTLTASNTPAILAAIRAHVKACQEREHEIYTAINAAEDHDDLNEININTGWPS